MMKRVFYYFFITVFICSCSRELKDKTTEILENIIENELATELNSKGKTFIYFLQNAECKCSEETLEDIRIFDQGRGKLIVLVNKKSHFALPKLDNVQQNLRYIGINTLLSYGFLQDKDLLVEIEKDNFFYINL